MIDWEKLDTRAANLTPTFPLDGKKIAAFRMVNWPGAAVGDVIPVTFTGQPEAGGFFRVTKTDGLLVDMERVESYDEAEQP